MMNTRNIQNALWAAFLLYYSYTKFFAAYQGYSHAYAIQVALIVIATAILPFYLTRWLARAIPGARLPIMIVVPSLIALTGYAAFFFVFISPNFPQISAAQVIPRGFVPGVVISLILLLPVIVGAIRGKGMPAGDTRA